MRRVLAVVLMTALLMTFCLMLTGCDKPKVRVESVLNIDSSFKGSRTVTVIYPLTADIDAVKEDILADAPAKNVEGVKFSYLGATEDGYSFEMKLSFGSKEQYEEQVSEIIGRDANAVLSKKNTVMFSGTRLQEDFDVREMVEWMERDTKEASATKDFEFEYPYNKATIGTDTFDTGSAVSVSDCKGIEVRSVDVKTYNEKNGLIGRTFDRSIVFAIPADIYSENKRKINEYYDDLVGDFSQISDTHEGNNVLFSITFEGLNLSALETATGKVLGSDSVTIYYGDKDSMSNPLFQGGVLEEALDTLSFYGPEGSPPKMKYTYSLPTNVVRGEGAVYENGTWLSRGDWNDGAYRLEDGSGMTRLRVYDGRQYRISGVDFSLESLGNKKFRRTTSFLYPLSDGFEGPAYATKFYKALDATAEYGNDGENIICSVVCEGTVDEVNAQLEKIFGKENYLTYEQRFGALSDKTTCVDHIDIREMLSMENMQVPMTYSVSAENGENIVTTISGSAERAYHDKDGSKVNVIGGNAVVGYHGVIPKIGNILIYLIFGFVLVGSTILLASRLMYAPISRRRSGNTPQPDGLLPKRSEQKALPAADDTPSYAPTQTTTFSIFELGVLSRNKKYAEEIDQDVNQRLHAQRLEERKKELRRKELEEMERKVYGEKENPAPVAEQPDDDTPRTAEILETFDKASKSGPEPAETADPIGLLDLMNGEEEDD